MSPGNVRYKDVPSQLRKSGPPQSIIQGMPCCCQRAHEGLICKLSQSEAERKRLLKRLGEARAAATQPHKPRWFTFHPEVRRTRPEVLLRCYDHETIQQGHN